VARDALPPFTRVTCLANGLFETVGDAVFLGCRPAEFQDQDDAGYEMRDYAMRGRPQGAPASELWTIKATATFHRGSQLAMVLQPGSVEWMVISTSRNP
jgi:hypothetical protein